MTFENTPQRPNFKFAFFFIVFIIHKLRFFLWESSSSFQVCKGTSSLPLSKWTKICGTQSNDAMNFYVDDELICTKSISPIFSVGEPTNCNPCTILLGAYYDSPRYYFVGKMDNVYVFDYVVNDITNLKSKDFHNKLFLGGSHFYIPGKCISYENIRFKVVGERTLFSKFPNWPTLPSSLALLPPPLELKFFSQGLSDF